MNLLFLIAPTVVTMLLICWVIAVKANYRKAKQAGHKTRPTLSEVPVGEVPHLNGVLVYDKDSKRFRIRDQHNRDITRDWTGSWAGYRYPLRTWGEAQEFLEYSKRRTVEEQAEVEQILAAARNYELEKFLTP